MRRLLTILHEPDEVPESNRMVTRFPNGAWFYPADIYRLIDGVNSVYNLLETLMKTVGDPITAQKISMVLGVMENMAFCRKG